MSRFRKKLVRPSVLVIPRTKAVPGLVPLLRRIPGARFVAAPCVVASSVEINGVPSLLVTDAKLAKVPAVAAFQGAAVVEKAAVVPRLEVLAPVRTEHPSGKREATPFKFCK